MHDGVARTGARRTIGEITFEGASVEESGPHGYEEGQRVRVLGLVKKPHFNAQLGTVDRQLDPFGMGRLAVRLDAGQELSLKFSNLEFACQLCSAVFGEALLLCPTCEAIRICAACKPAHVCHDKNGKIGVTIGIGEVGRFALLDVLPGSPAEAAGFRPDDILLAVDGIPVTGTAGYPEILGPVGSDVTLRVERGASEFTATVRRGRQPKFADALLNAQVMPGMRVLALLSQSAQTCTYKVAMADNFGVDSIGLLKWDLATGGGNVLLPCSPEVGNALGLPERGQPEYDALADCHDRFQEMEALASKGKWKALVKRSKEAGALVEELERLASGMLEGTQRSVTFSRGSDTANSLAVALGRERRPQEAADWHRRAMKLADAAGDEEARGIALSGLGDALDDCGQYQEAIAVYDECVEIARRRGNYHEQMTRVHKIAVTHENNKQLAAARQSYEEMKALMIAVTHPGSDEILQFEELIAHRLRTALARQ